MIVNMPYSPHKMHLKAPERLNQAVRFSSQDKKKDDFESIVNSPGAKASERGATLGAILGGVFGTPTVASLWMKFADPNIALDTFMSTVAFTTSILPIIVGTITGGIWAEKRYAKKMKG